MEEMKFKVVKPKIGLCDCGRILVCEEDEKNHLKQAHNTGREIQIQRNWQQSNEELAKMIGIQILALERGYILEV